VHDPARKRPRDNLDQHKRVPDSLSPCEHCSPLGPSPLLRTCPPQLSPRPQCLPPPLVARLTPRQKPSAHADSSPPALHTLHGARKASHSNRGGGNALDLNRVVGIGLGPNAAQSSPTLERRLAREKQVAQRPRRVREPRQARPLQRRCEGIRLTEPRRRSEWGRQEPRSTWRERRQIDSTCRCTW
jgi:hypothetical protein